MIVSRITADALASFPAEVVDALGLKPGDSLAYRIENGEVRIVKAASLDPFENPFATFTEWADEADCAAFDNL